MSKLMVFRTRRNIAALLTERLFFKPLRETLSELVDSPDIPLFVYMFDYVPNGKSEIYPEGFVQSYYGKFHSLDVPFVLGSMKKDSKNLIANENDEKVQKTFNDFIGLFMRSSDDGLHEHFHLKKYRKGSEVVNRISEKGIESESKACLEAWKNASILKAAVSYFLIKVFGNSF